MANDDIAGRERLSSAMQARHHELDLSWDSVARAAGLSIAHLRRVRTGDVPLTSKAKWKIERALRWNRGSIDRVLAGHEAEPAEDPLPTVQVDLPPDVALERLEPWEAHLWLTPQLPIGDRRTLVELIRRLRER